MRFMCVCRGELVKDCRSLDGSSQQQCFVQGLTGVQDCDDTRNYPTELASTLLAQGKGADGQEGSICTTVLSTATPATAKGARPSALVLISHVSLVSPTPWDRFRHCDCV